MRKVLIPILLAVLLLLGCHAEPTNNPGTTADAPSGETSSPLSSQPQTPRHPLEEATGGSIQIWDVPVEEVYGVACMGGDLLLLSGYDWTTLTLLAGDTMEVTAQVVVPTGIYAEEASVRISDKGVTYYDSGQRQVVFLGPDLTEAERIQLPEKFEGFPVVSQDRRFLYYSTDDEIRVIDAQNGLDRLLRSTAGIYYNLTELLCDGTVLQCSVVDGTFSTVFLSAETGETLAQVDDSLVLSVGQNAYYLTRMDGSYTERLAGRFGEDPLLLFCDAEYLMDFPLPEQDAVIYRTQTDNGISLDYYELATGFCPYRLRIPEQYSVFGITSDASGSGVWMLCYDEAAGSTLLCHWDPEMNPTGDTSSHFRPRSTAENPDLDGIARCREQAAVLEQTYGVRILLWKDALEMLPAAYTVEPEYQTAVIRQDLNRLDEVLRCFPKDFYSVSAVSSGQTPLNICLVRSLTGDVSMRALESAQGLTCWSEDGQGYIFLPAGSLLTGTFFHEMSHVIDIRVISACSAYDDWYSLNPPGFEYDYDYITNLDRFDYDYLEEDNRFFIDTYAMSFPTEDRATIMEYAMQTGNGDFFISEPMQAKLRRICVGIREAYNLTDSDGPLLWEQYLKTSIT